MVHGASTQRYGGTRDHPFQGVCQFNGAGTGLWLRVFYILIQYLIQEGHTVDLVATISGIKRSMAALIFVDNNYIMK